MILIAHEVWNIEGLSLSDSQYLSPAHFLYVHISSITPESNTVTCDISCGSTPRRLWREAKLAQALRTVNFILIGIIIAGIQ